MGLAGARAALAAASTARADIVVVGGIDTPKGELLTFAHEGNDVWNFRAGVDINTRTTVDGDFAT